MRTIVGMPIMTIGGSPQFWMNFNPQCVLFTRFYVCVVSFAKLL